MARFTALTYAFRTHPATGFAFYNSVSLQLMAFFWSSHSYLYFPPERFWCIIEELQRVAVNPAAKGKPDLLRLGRGVLRNGYVGGIE